MFNFRFDKKIIIIIIAIMLFWWITSIGVNGLLGILFTIPGVLIAMTFHEYAHAWAADKLGDETPRMQGRLSLNPITHIDPLGFVLLLVAGFGWGKPVQIDSRNFTGKYNIAKSEAIVAAAGPIMNFILAFVFLIIYYLIFNFTNWLSGNVAVVVHYVLYYTIIINIGLGVFNLIPLPPLDGSKILMNFLSYRGKEWMYRNERYFYIAFILLWITGLLSTILQPVFAGVYFGMNWLVVKIFSLFI